MYQLVTEAYTSTIKEKKEQKEGIIKSRNNEIENRKIREKINETKS